jgi:hypothetical protein
LLDVAIVCGTLDIVYAIVAALIGGGDIAAMLRGIAAGAIREGCEDWGLAGALLGLAVHFLLMGIMAALLQQALRIDRIAALPAWLTDLARGVDLYLVMYGLVLPAHFDTSFPPPTFGHLANGLVPHIVLVGIPMALILKRKRTPR